mgnify:CR=1 FL=1
MRRLLHLLADGDLYPVTLINRLNSWSGDPASNKDDIPLRLAAGLHTLVLSGQDPALKACYPPKKIRAAGKPAHGGSSSAAQSRNAYLAMAKLYPANQ